MDVYNFQTEMQGWVPDKLILSARMSEASPGSQFKVSIIIVAAVENKQRCLLGPRQCVLQVNTYIMFSGYCGCGVDIHRVTLPVEIRVCSIWISPQQ